MYGRWCESKVIHSIHVLYIYLHLFYDKSQYMEIYNKCLVHDDTAWLTYKENCEHMDFSFSNHEFLLSINWVTAICDAFLKAPTNPMRPNLQTLEVNPQPKIQKAASKKRGKNPTKHTLKHRKMKGRWVCPVFFWMFNDLFFWLVISYARTHRQGHDTWSDREWQLGWTVGSVGLREQNV